MTLLPVDTLLKPVVGHDDLVQFRYDFTLEGKALDDGTVAQTITETADGDLIIEGYAAVFDGLDRERENFAPGAFNAGIKAFVGGQAGLCYHHKHDLCLGKVLDLHEEEGKGLKMKARVDGAIQTHPVMGTIYQQIKKGTLNALSVGGFFKRLGNKIVGMDFTEISITPVPVHPGTNFAVVAGKALVSDVNDTDHVTVTGLPAGDEEIREDDLMWLNEALDSIERIVERINKRNPDNATAAA